MSSKYNSIRIFKNPIPKTNFSFYESSESLNRLEELSKNKLIDFACSLNGGQVIRVSNEHYGPAKQLISPYPPIHMFDGFESSRSRCPNHFEEIVLKLGRSIYIDHILFDFTYFVNNSPKEMSIYGLTNSDWIMLKNNVPVKAFSGNKKKLFIHSKEKFNQLLFQVHPDGGINRIKVFGTS